MKTILRNFLSIFRRFKMATILNIAGLSVAFAAFMVIFMQLDYDWGFAKSHPDSDCIYRLEIIADNGPRTVLARPLVEAFIQSSPHIKAGSMVLTQANLEIAFTIEKNGQQHNYREPAIKVSPEFTEVFEFDMVEGDSRALHEPDKGLIPLSMSKKLFGGESAIGKQLTIEGAVFTIGGVYKDFPKNAITKNDLYACIDPMQHKDDWGYSIYQAYLRLDSPESAAGLVDNFRKNFDVSNLGVAWINNFDARLTPIHELHFTTDTAWDYIPKSSRTTLLALLTIAIVIILIAGINFTNFSMALTPMRIKSINTQKVLGAKESLLRAGLLSEAMILSMLSYLVAIGLVFWFSKTSLAVLVSADVSITYQVSIVLATGLIALITGFLAGIYPAYYSTSFSPALVLKGSFGLSPKGRNLRTSLISVQFIASFALIICAVFIYLQNNFMQKSPLGYDREELIISDIPLAMVKDKKTYADELKSYAGIKDVTFSDMIISSTDSYLEFGRLYRDKRIDFQCIPVDVSFLRVMGIEVIEGRDFREEDNNATGGRYIFNQKAKNTFGFEVGEKIEDLEIIGIIDDVKFTSFRKEVEPMAFYVWGENKWWPEFMNAYAYAYIKLNAGTDVNEAISHIKTTSAKFSPQHSFDIRFFDDIMNRLYEGENRLSMLIILFSLIAVFISIVGVFGLVVFDSEYRRKEIGIRKVLGSTVREILVLLNTSYIRVLCICFIVAAPISWYVVSKWLENFAYRTSMSWWVFMLAFSLVALITTGTVTFQSWRVANANPINSIKTE